MKRPTNSDINDTFVNKTEITTIEVIDHLKKNGLNAKLPGVVGRRK